MLKDHIERRKPKILAWEHVSVVCDIWEGYEQYKDWHSDQVAEAIATVGRQRPNALRMIPGSGFYISALRAPSKRYREYWEDHIASIVSLDENMDEIYSSPLLSGEDVCQRTIMFLHHRDFSNEWMGKNNPWIALLNEFADKLPTEWAQWLKWRRFRRWTPVPEWLLAMRAKSRHRKRRQLPE